MINLGPSLWRVPPAGLVRGRYRKIAGGPLIALPALQAAIASGRLRADDVWPATRRCSASLEGLNWSYDDVLRILSALQQQDFHGSEWCDIEGGRSVPADAYVVRYDEHRAQRSSRALGFYLKFSLDEAGVLTLVLVQCHLS